MNAFAYEEPNGVANAVALLSSQPGKAKLIAGGTDLMLQLRDHRVEPDPVVNLGSLTELDYLERTPEGALRIGALATIRTIETSQLVATEFTALADAAKQFGSFPIRNLATIGGNVCSAVSSGDMLPPLLIFDAKVTLVGPKGERTLLLQDFFSGPSRTVIEPDEILTEILVPALPASSGSVYLKLARRRAQDIAIVAVAASVTPDPSRRTCIDARIALGAVAPTPIRAPRAEAVLRGKPLDPQIIREAAQTASAESRPISDIRASKAYRQQMVSVYVRRAVELASARAAAGEERKTA